MSETKVVHTPEAYSKPEELTNFITHAVAAALSIVGLVFMLLKAGRHDGKCIASVIVFGALLVYVFILSAAEHALPDGSPARTVISRLVRCGESTLCLGAFTPVFLYAFPQGSAVDGVWGYVLFSLLAACVVVITAVNVCNVNGVRMVNMFLYVGIAWICVLRIELVIKLFGSECFYTLVAGCIMFFCAKLADTFRSAPSRVISLFLATAGAALCFVSIYTFML